MTLVLKLVRHGESAANTGEIDPLDVGDRTIFLTERGSQQAVDAGRTIGAAFIRDALIHCSPFQRARQTLRGILEGAGLSKEELQIYEDPRLREVDHGYAPVAHQEVLRRRHGRFYYRFDGGESPADCYDRTSSFLDGLMRQVERK